MEKNNNKLRDACHEAFLCFKKMGDLKNSEIQSKLEFVVGSYDYDKNPVGLFEIGKIALKILEEIKAKNPKKISNKVIADLEESLRK